MDRPLAYTFVLLTAVALSAACAGQPTTSTSQASTGRDEGRPHGVAAPVSRLLLDTSPREGVPVFVGYSHRLRDREAEKAAALDNAAKQAARYLEVRASTVLISQRSGTDVGYARAVRTREPAHGNEDVREGLEIMTTVQDHNGTAVMVSAPQLPKLPAPVPVPERVAGRGADQGTDRGTDPGADAPNRPAWVERPPEIDGYAVGVGVVRRRRNLADSIEAVDEDALADIILKRSSHMRAIGDSQTIEGEATTERTTRAETAVAVIRGFYVLSRRISPDGRYHYALAVARPAAETTAGEHDGYTRNGGPHEKSGSNDTRDEKHDVD